MAEQNQGMNPPQATAPAPDAPAGNSGAAEAPIPAYPKRRSRKRLILILRSSC